MKTKKIYKKNKFAKTINYGKKNLLLILDYPRVNSPVY